VRSAVVRLQNRRRRARNVRRVLLGLVYQRTLGDQGPVGVEEAHRYVASKLPEDSIERNVVEAVLHDLAAELDAEVTSDESGALLFGFPGLRREVLAGEVMRRRLELDERSLGDIVFSTSDTAEEADERDRTLFDRALAEEVIDLDRRLPSVDRVAYEDDYELVAFDEELDRHAASKR